MERDGGEEAMPDLDFNEIITAMMIVYGLWFASAMILGAIGQGNYGDRWAEMRRKKRREKKKEEARARAEAERAAAEGFEEEL